MEGGNSYTYEKAPGAPNAVERESHLTFRKETTTILLHAEPEVASFEEVRSVAQKEGLTQKEEFHITIIGRETGEAIAKIVSSKTPEEGSELLRQIEDLSKRYAWSNHYLPDYYFIRKDYNEEGAENVETRKSIIQTVSLPDLEAFYRELNALLGTDFSIPFPHVTLFAASTNEENNVRGIGLYSEKQLQALQPVRIEPDQSVS